MIYCLLLYHARTGLFLYSLTLQKLVKDDHAMVGAFFSALKSFASEMIFSSSVSLKMIQMDNYELIFAPISQISADMVVVVDIEDKPAVKKVIPDIINVIIKNQRLFRDWRGDLTRLRALDEPLTDLLSFYKSLPSKDVLISNRKNFAQFIKRVGEVNSKEQ